VQCSFTHQIEKHIFRLKRNRTFAGKKHALSLNPSLYTSVPDFVYNWQKSISNIKVEKYMNQNELQDLIRVLEEMPNFTAQLAIGLSDVELKRKPTEIDFSLTEQVWHLRDIEELGYTVRIKKLLSEDHPLLSDIDGAKLAIERDYNSLDFAEGQQGFARMRSANIEKIRGLSLEQLGRTGQFDDSTEVTLEGVLLMMRDHDAVHRNELMQFSRGTKLME